MFLNNFAETFRATYVAIVWAVKHFRPYVYGTKFKIVIDHKPLIWLFNVNNLGSRLIRWRLKLEEYNYEIIHKAGRANANTDALSRNVRRDAPRLEEERDVYAIKKMKYLKNIITQIRTIYRSPTNRRRRLIEAR